MNNPTESINLGDFIAEVLIQITDGIKKAQENVKPKGAIINSSRTYMNTTTKQLILLDSQQSQVAEEIEFDIAVTAATKADIKGGTGIMIPVIGIGYQAQKGYDSSTVSRIKFSIPVAFPQQD